ncbi:peptidase E [bacterium]|nr:peptidase E [bacterium]
MKHYIIQCGSGKPGEMGTQETEFKIIQKIGNPHLKIGFAPFHHLSHEHANDWTIFQDIVQELTSEPIQLIEFHTEKDMELLKQKILSFDLLVLGSGVCEPYFEFFNKNKIDQVFQEYFSLGKHIMGYSAGSIALGEKYIHTMFFQEVFLHWNQVKDHMNDQELQDLKDEMMQDCPDKFKKQLDNTLQRETIDISIHTLSPVPFQVTSMDALSFVNNSSMLPHFNEAMHATTTHLLTAARDYPTVKHYGVPNGAALFHTFEDQKHIQSEVVGENRHPQLLVTEFVNDDQKNFLEGEVI